MEEYRRRIDEVVQGLDPERDRRQPRGGSLLVRNEGLLPVDALRQMEVIGPPSLNDTSPPDIQSAKLKVRQGALASGRGLVYDSRVPDLRHVLEDVLDRVQSLAAGGLRMRVLTCRACSGLYPVRFSSRAKSCTRSCQAKSAGS